MPPNNQLPAHHAPVGLKVWLAIFGVLLAGTLGYFVWAENNNAAEESADYSAPKVAKTTSSAVVCDDVTAGLKNYSTTAQGFCFNYPSDWILTDEADVANKIVWRVALTDKVVPNSDYPGQFHVFKYKTLADLNSQGLTATTLKEYLDASAAASDPSFINITETTFGGQAAYLADAGPNQLSGGKYYFVELDDLSIVQVWVVTDSTDTANIVSSFKFTS